MAGGYQPIRHGGTVQPPPRKPVDLTKLARGEACTNCGHVGDDVVLAHYSGIRQHRYGKGRGIKCDDWYGAPQCGPCHRAGPFTEGWLPPGSSGIEAKVDKSEEQLHQIATWHRSLMERGIL